MNCRRLKLLLRLCALGLLVSGCHDTPPPVDPMQLSGAYIPAGGLRCIVKFRKATGKWPTSTLELTKQGILPVKSKSGPGPRDNITLTDENFKILNVKKSGKSLEINYSVNGKRYTQMDLEESILSFVP